MVADRRSIRTITGSDDVRYSEGLPSYPLLNIPFKYSLDIGSGVLRNVGPAGGGDYTDSR